MAQVSLSDERDAREIVLIWRSPSCATTESGAVVRVVDVERDERG